VGVSTPILERFAAHKYLGEEADMEDTKVRIREYLERTTRHPDLRDDQNIFEDGIVNSIFAVELVIFIEEQFGIAIENEDLDLANFASIDALSSFVSRKTAATSP